MKKILFTSAIILGLYSCGGSDSAGPGEELTPLTVEQGKQELEDNALGFLTEIDNFKNDDALTEIKEISDVLLIETGGKSIGSKTFTNLIDLQSGKIDLVEFNSKIFGNVGLINDYNSETGIYEWNSLNQDWDKTGDNENIVYKVAYNNKTAEFVVSNFTTQIYALDNEEVPTSLNASLTVGTNEIFSQAYRATIDNGKYLPNSISNDIKIGGLALNTKLTNESNTTLKFETGFSISGKSLMNYYVSIKGNFNEIDTNGENISTNTTYEDILDSSEFSISILNAKITGKVTEPSTIPEGDVTTDEAVKLLNDNVIVDITINDKLIAKGQFYSDEYVYYDYYTGQDVTETEPNLRFLFDDGTTADFDTYFGEGFSSIEDKLTEIIDNYIAKFE